MFKWIFAGALVSLAGPAVATTLGGGITDGTQQGVFVKLDPSTGIAVGNDTYQSNNLYAFDEDQNIRLAADLRVDVGAHGKVIPSGTVIASHYVFFDPLHGAAQRGYVEFDAAVLGIATSRPTLRATDFLVNTNVTYLNPTLRGLEWEDRVWIDPDNPYRIRVDWQASTPGDYVRVFTALSPGV
ncbi:MAG: hypothetical protein AAF713_16285 [Pseudomonadota bacterium]